MTIFQQVLNQFTKQEQEVIKRYHSAIAAARAKVKASKHVKQSEEEKRRKWNEYQRARRAKLKTQAASD